jgi:hypothetical protein
MCDVGRYDAVQISIGLVYVRVCVCVGVCGWVCDASHTHIHITHTYALSVHTQHAARGARREGHTRTRTHPECCVRVVPPARLMGTSFAVFFLFNYVCLCVEWCVCCVCVCCVCVLCVCVVCVLCVFFWNDECNLVV